MKKLLTLTTSLLLLLVLASCVEDQTTTTVTIQDFTDAEYEVLSQRLDIPRTIEVVTGELPRHMQVNQRRGTTNTLDSRKALLGRVLFYDTQLSITGEKSCASCHHQSAAFADPEALSEGINGQLTKRNSLALASTPSFESSYGSSDNADNFVGFFWDDRANSITVQSEETIENEIEMGHDLEALAEQLRGQEMYRILNEKAFQTPEISKQSILQSLEVFVNSIISGSSRFDRLTDQEVLGPNANNEPSWTPQEQQGRALYNQRCASCHSFDMSFPARAFANNGLDIISEDKGKGEISGEGFNGVFKVPFLRNIELTAPYMHDGRFATLEEVIDHYSENIQPHRNLARELKTLNGGEPLRMSFTDAQKASLIAFLKTVTDDRLPFEERLSDPFK